MEGGSKKYCFQTVTSVKVQKLCKSDHFAELSDFYWTFVCDSLTSSHMTNIVPGMSVTQ